ncbi:hypothetical protein GQ457_10G011350 [Hibiscus cannabinus]
MRTISRPVLSEWFDNMNSQPDSFAMDKELDPGGGTRVCVSQEGVLEKTPSLKNQYQNHSGFRTVEIELSDHVMDLGLTGFTALEGYFDDVGSILGGKHIWEVRTRNWKLREGENRLSGLLEGISVTFGIGTYIWVSVLIGFGIGTLFRVSVPFDTGIGTTPLSTDTGSLGQFLGVLRSMISYVLVPELAVYDFMSLNDSFYSKFHTRACKTTNHVLITLK